jgi:hypothetical protein
MEPFFASDPSLIDFHYQKITKNGVAGSGAKKTKTTGGSAAYC